MAKAAECKHRWLPFTKWKATCPKCGRHLPWTDIVREASESGEARGFTQGVGYSCAEVIRSHDEPTIAADIAIGAGVSYEDFKSARLSAYDLKSIRKFMSPTRKDGR